MAQGIDNSAACRIVGVNRRTGTRWRYGRSVTDRTGRTRTYPSISRPTPPVSAHFLSADERVAIADGLIHGRSLRDIAEELGRAPSTLSREIRRNRDVKTGRYQPFRAQRRAAARRLRPKARKLAHEGALRAFVQEHVGKRWSPEQISQSLRELFPERPGMRVGHEAIYQDRTGWLEGQGGPALADHRAPGWDRFTLAFAAAPVASPAAGRASAAAGSSSRW